MIAIPFIVFLLATAAVRPRAAGWREAMLIAATSLALAVALATEAASWAQVLNPTVSRCLWNGAAYILGVHVFRLWRAGRIPVPAWSRATAWWVCLGLVLPVFAAALLWPPNNYDCAVYHLPRVFAWAQQGSVAHFPTPIARQLYQPPLMEYLLLQLQLLDAPVFAFNFFAACVLLGAGLASSLIVQRMVAKAWAGPLAFTLIVTLPSAVLQGSDPKNDILLGFWCLAAAYWALDFRAYGRIGSLAGAGLALALAVLTKGTAWIMLPALGLLLALAPARAWTAAVRRPGLLLAIGLALAVVLPHHLRNQATFGNPLTVPSGPGDPAYGNDRHDSGAVISNVLRNLAIELQTPWPAVNAGIQAPVAALHRLLHEDLNSPGTTWPGTAFDVAPPARWHEDMMPNPLATLLLAAAGLTAVVRRRSVGPEALLLGGAALLSFLLFCTLLKWQPWHSRLHLPIYFLGLTFAAAVMATAWPAWLRGVVVALAAAGGAAAGWFNESRPLADCASTRALPVERRLFQNNLGLYADYREAASRILADAPRSVGLVFGRNDWEYPLWYWLGAAVSPPTVQHWGATFAPDAGPRPRPAEFLVATASRDVWEALHLASYTRVLSNPSFELYRDTASVSRRVVQSDAFIRTVFVGENWYSEERTPTERWRWAGGPAAVRLLPRDPVAGLATLRLQLSSYGRSQRIEIVDDLGTLLWAGTAPAGSRIELVLAHVKIGPTGTMLHLRPDQHSAVAPQTDTRKLSYAVFNLLAVEESDP